MPRAVKGWGDGRERGPRPRTGSLAARGSPPERSRKRAARKTPYRQPHRQMEQPTMKSVQSAATKDGLGGLERELHATFQASRLPARQKQEQR